MITAIGVSFILVNVGLVWKGASQVNYPDLLPRVDILRDIFHINTLILFTLKDLLVILIAVPLMVGLTLFVQRTRLGKAMRATAQDRTAAAMMGIDINTTIALTFLIGGALAGIPVVIFAAVKDWTAVLNPAYTLPAPLIGSVVGLLAGAYPALRAARTSPLAALRHA